MSSSPVTFSPPGSFKNETKTTISSPNTVATNSEAKDANMKQEREEEKKQLVNLGPSLTKTQQAKQESSAPVPASVTSPVPASVTSPVPAPGTDNLDTVLNQLKLKYNNNNSTLMALQTKLNNNLSSIKALRINASDNANDAQKSIDNARKIAEESASKEIENLSNQLNKINFKDLSASIFDLQTEETNIQKAIDEINKTKDDGSGTAANKSNIPPKKNQELGGGKRKTKRRRSRKNSKKSKRRSKRH